MDDEFQALASEITRIGKTFEFNSQEIGSTAEKGV